MGFYLAGRKKRGRARPTFQLGTFLWFPLWSFVCREAGDILEPIDQEGCCFNQGHYVSVAKARALGERLELLLRRRVVSAESGRHIERARKLRQQKCPDCRGRGVTTSRLDGRVVRERCFECDGSGRRRAGPAFRTVWVREFAGFCAKSGGFWVY